MRIMAAMLISAIVLTGVQPLHAQTIDFAIRFNGTTGNFEVYARPTGSLSSNFNTAGSQIGVVLPSLVDDIPLSITTVNGGPWTDISQNFSPAAQTQNDFHAVATMGSDVDFSTAGAEVLLFTFSLSSCVDGVRLFNTGSDPDAGAAGMDGADYSSYITDGFGDFTGSAYNNNGSVCSTLPLTLLSFTGDAIDHQVHLKWITISEYDISHFEIERMVDTENWQKSGTVKAIGDNEARITYQFVDNRPHRAPGTMYYRLRIVDTDSTYSYSRVISVNEDVAARGLSVYPNPVRPGQLLNVRGGQDGALHTRATIADAHGKVVRVVTGAELKQRAIHTSGLLPGVYFLRIDGKERTHVEKIVVY